MQNRESNIPAYGWRDQAYSLWNTLSKWPNTSKPPKPTTPSKRLIDINYPDEFIPESYIDDITAEIMSDPVHLFDAQYFWTLDNSSLKAFWHANPSNMNKHPVTKTNLNKHNIVQAKHLKNEIAKFVERQEGIYELEADNARTVFDRNFQKETETAEIAYKKCKLMGSIFHLQQSLLKLEEIIQKKPSSAKQAEYNKLKQKLKYRKIQLRIISTCNPDELTKQLYKLISLDIKDETTKDEIDDVIKRIELNTILRQSKYAKDTDKIKSTIKALANHSLQNHRTQQCLEELFTRLHASRNSSHELTTNKKIQLSDYKKNLAFSLFDTNEQEKRSPAKEKPCLLPLSRCTPEE